MTKKLHTHIPLLYKDIRRSRRAFGATPRTTALGLLPTDATRDEWLQARHSHLGQWRLGASELAAVLGCSPHTSAFSLWWSKQDTWSGGEPSINQTIGLKLEDVIGELWAETHPEMLLCRPGSALYGHPEVDWLVCTPDFLAVVANHPDDVMGVHIEPVECKSDEGGQGWGKPGTAEVPAHHRVQVYVQCEILGAPRGHVMRLAGKRPSAYVLPYDDEAKADMAAWLRDGAAFITSLAEDQPPDVDGHASTTATLQRIHAAYVEGKTATLPYMVAYTYQSTHAALEIAKQEFDEARNKVRAALGDAQIGTDAEGRKVVKRNVYKRRGYEVGPAMVDELRRIN